MKKPRILILTGIFPPDTGGPATYTEKMGRYLQDAGFEVILITFGEKNCSEQYPYDVVRISRKTMRPFRDMLFFLQMLRKLRGVEVIFDNGAAYDTGYLAAFVSFFTGIPHIVKVVGDGAWEYAVRSRKTSDALDDFLKSEKRGIVRILEIIQKAVWKSCEMIIVPSFYLAGVVSSYSISEKKIRVIYNAAQPVDPSFKMFNIFCFNQEKKFFLTAARLTPWKGIDILLKVFSQLPDSYHLLIAGDGPEKENLESISRNLHLDGKVSFLGNLPREEIAGLMKNVRAFILNSTYEGLPHVLLEAFSCGCPVIASLCGGNKELVEDGSGIGVRYGSLKELMDALKLLAESDDARQQYIYSGYRKLESFSLKRQVKETLNVMRTVRQNSSKRVLMLSVGEQILKNPLSDSRQRHLEYAEQLDLLVMIAYADYQEKLPLAAVSRKLLVRPSHCGKWLFFFEALFLSIYYIRKFGISVVTTQDPFITGMIGVILKAVCGVKLDMQNHSDFFSSKRFIREKPVQYGFYLLLGKLILRFADSHRVLNFEEKNAYAGYGIPEKKISVITTPVNSARFFEKYDEKSRTQIRSDHEISDCFCVFWAGRITPAKDWKLLLRIASLSRENGSDIRFLVAGDGEEDEEFNKEIQKRGLSDIVRRAGRVPHEKLPQYYQAADLYLHTAYYEGFGKTIVEAMLSGLPVISTSTSGARYILDGDNGGIVINEREPRIFYMEIIRMKQSPDLRREMSEKAFKSASERFDRKKGVSEIIRSWTESL